jgi:DNA-binding GntR family transcriptional regulator
VSDDGFHDLPLARASTLVQQVHAELKQRILDGRLTPGIDVPDSVIAKQMGVSRAPVRDACNLLVQTGLLTKQQNYPYRVRDFATSDVGELQLIRWGYESAAARQLVRTGTDPAGCRPPLERMTEAVAARDALASAEADIEFHRALVQASGLPQLIDRYGSLADQIAIVMRQLPLFVVTTQRHRHEELLEGLRQSQTAHDPATILGLLEAHLLTRREDVTANEQLQPPA